MMAKQRGTVTMAKRVLEFSRANPLAETSYTTWLGRLEESVAKADATGAQQLSGFNNRRGANARRNAVRGRLHTQLLPLLVRAGRKAGLEQPGLGENFHLPKVQTPNAAFLVAVQVMVTDAEANAEVMQRNGMYGTLLTEVKQAIAEFEEAAEQARTARREHVTASAGLDVVEGEIHDAVSMLDGINRYRFAKDATLLAAWRSAKNTVGPFHSAGDVPPAAGGDTKAA